jgi:hypothetical protein
MTIRHRDYTSLAIVLFALSLTGCMSADYGGDEDQGMDMITPSLLKRNIDILASDAMMGRATPSSQLDSAARYIAGEFETDGLEPVQGSNFQQFGLNIVNLGSDNRLRITKDGQEQSFALKDDFVPFEMTANREASGSIVFAGYGITAPEYHYDDYAAIDVRGKIVLVLRHEPREEDADSPFRGKKATQYSGVEEKARNALDHGAAALLVVTDPLNHGNMMPRGFPWPSLSKSIPVDALPMTLVVNESKKIPVVHIGAKVVNLLLGSVEVLKLLQARIDSTMTPLSYALPGVTGYVKSSTIIKNFTTRNVVGFCPGSDPGMKNEIIVIGAHYDHVGYRKGSPAGQDSIYNGADDDASGTSGVLALAKAFGSLHEKPKRSLLFIAFAGEEEGLLGSLAYVGQPLFPLMKTVAMLNLDMIGRNTIDSLYLISSALSPDLTKIALLENRYIGFKIGYTEEPLVYGGDHGPFLQNKIPIIFFHAGLHADYHQVTDEPQRINYHKAARITRLVFRVAMRIADGHEYYHTAL